MADVKISQLPAYASGTSPSTADALPIVDSSSATYVTRQIPWSAFTSIKAGSSGTVRRGTVTLLAGSNITISDDGTGQITIASSGGGGGGGFSSVTAKWTTANATSKNAYSSQPTVNNDGITISLTASSNPGTLGTATVSLNSVAVSTTYSVSGTFPNYTITVPQADITGLAAQTAATVTVTVAIGSSYNLTANNLTNNQPIAFAATLSASYSVSSVPYYTTTASATYSYSVTGTATSYAGTINGTSAPNASGTLTGLAVTGLTIAGSATGNGSQGAPSGATVTLSGSTPALSTYVPAFYAQTTTSTAPTFTTSSSSTTAGALNSVITYGLPTASTYYDWIAVDSATLTLTNIYVRTVFGDAPLVPDVTATSQTISGKTFLVYGFTNLSTTTAVVLVIK